MDKLLSKLVRDKTLLDFIKWDETKRYATIRTVVGIVDKVAHDAALFLYNNKSNSFSSVFAMLISLAKVELVSDEAETVDDLELYNLMTNRAADMNIIVMEYMKENFSNLKLTSEDYLFIADYNE